MQETSQRSSISTKGMSREEWLTLRKAGLGGSDAAAVMGANPYHSPLAVYFDKLGIAPERDTTEAMRQGTDLEQYVAERFCEETGFKVRRVNQMLRHPDYPWMLANIDRSVVGEYAGLECKTTSVYNKSDFSAGIVPETYLWQCMHYMAVTGMHVWYLAVLVLNKSFHVYKIDRDESLINSLMDREREFWHNHVLAKIPPLPSGSESDDDLIIAMNTSSESPGESVDLSYVKETLDLLPYLKADRDAAKQRYEAAKQQVTLSMGSAEYGSAGNWIVSNKWQSRTDVDAKALKKELPGIFESYSKTTRYPVFRAKEAQ